jgi:hypothetical protein
MPTSPAEKLVKKNFATVKRNRKLEGQFEHERATAVARKKREDFERAATLRFTLISEEFNFLEKEIRKMKANLLPRYVESRPNTRIYLKVPVYSDSGELSLYGSGALRFNHIISSDR